MSLVDSLGLVCVRYIHATCKTLGHGKTRAEQAALRAQASQHPHISSQPQEGSMLRAAQYGSFSNAVLAAALPGWSVFYGCV